MRTISTSLVVLASASVPALADTPTPNPVPAPTATMQLTSPAFSESEPIPMEFSCEGKNISPPLSWSNAPAGTKSFALVVEDPDATKGTFTHWMVLGIPATTTTLAKGAVLPAGAQSGRNGKGAAGYTGPCPPQGNHHYVFTLYALDIATPRAATPVDLYKVAEGHILGEAKLTGMYAKHR
jgi:Raf kinase inhibitor-like YbhB/YbcL family protein